MPVRIAEEWFSICGGCEVAILDIGEPLLDLLPKLEFVHMPVLMDHKLRGQIGEKPKMEIPEADIGLISGGIRNEEHLELAQEMRKKCKTLVAIGSCACFGGIPALANQSTVAELMEKVYRGSRSTDPAPNPSEDLPGLTDRVYALDEKVKVDAYIPGCPMSPEIIAETLISLIEGKPYSLPERSVCDDCPTKREKKALTSVKRPLESILDLKAGEELDGSRCFMEKGFLCLGPVTRSGCYRSGESVGDKVHIPRCIKGNMPCRGCFGPIRQGANPMVDMMGAIASIGLDAKDIPDRAATFNRYIGGQGRLRPLPAKK